jgi:hypothetical protein
MNNPPAFPNPHYREAPGMTLRDYFAAQAMQAIVSTVPHLAVINPEHAAIEAYEYADAMLKAREA